MVFSVARFFRRGLPVLAAMLWCAQASAQQLTVSAAASLTDAFQAIAPMFEAQHPGVSVRLNFAASGVLLQQIAQGAPVDVFASADQDTMDRAAAQALIDGASRRDFAANALVLIEPAQGGAGLRGLDGLRSDGVRRIAIGKPATVPVGRYGREALEQAGLWLPLAAKFVQADSVRQVLDYVARGEAEAGLVYRTDAAAFPGKVRVVAVLDLRTPVRYPVAVAADSARPEWARAFAAYLATPAAQSVLQRHGFAAP